MLSSLPQLRDELAVYPGPHDVCGAPSWSLHDPVRNLFFRIDWPTFEVLSRWDMGSADAICQAINRDTTLALTTDSVVSIIEFLQQHELLKKNSARDTRMLTLGAQQREQHWFSWLLHHYLFFRVPLWNPDRFLTRTLPWVRFLGGRRFALLTGLVLLIGLIETVRQWQQFSTTLFDMFSLQGLLFYGLTLIFVKLLHELGHAYTAKRFGCRVPAMGMAFLVMFPMAYTDVNNAWKLPDKGQRLKIGAAGIFTELTIAAWATLAWAMLPDSGLRNVCFLLASTTWISTLLVNASPFLRFDGYFLLMDALELPNLHPRAFALGRWRLRELLFRLGDPVPELFNASLHRLLLLFAWGTWCYRLIVFTGIAALVYLTFPKPLGPFLAAVEIIWFILRPVMDELRVWTSRGSHIMQRGRVTRPLLLLLLIISVIWLPWDRRVSSQGLLAPAQQVLLVAPGAAQVTGLLAASGQQVQQGESLIRLTSPELESQLASARIRAQGLQWQMDAVSLVATLREQQQVIGAEQQRVAAEIQGLTAELDKFQLRAVRSGTLYWSDPDFQQDDWVQKNTLLGQIVEPNSYAVTTYLKQQDLARIEAGDRAYFYAESDRIPPLALTVSRIDTDATRVLPEGILASTSGGALLVRTQRNQLIPEDALYHVTLQPESDAQTALMADVPPELRGKIVIYGEPRSWARKYWRSLLALFRREAGF